MTTKPIRPNIVTLFNKIGSTAGTAPPSNNKMTKILHEYFVARVLANTAAFREADAKNALLKLMAERKFDPEAVAIGDNVPVMNDRHYFLSLKVTTPPMKVNMGALRGELLEIGVPDETISAAIVAAQEPGTAAKIYTIIQK